MDITYGRSKNSKVFFSYFKTLILLPRSCYLQQFLCVITLFFHVYNPYMYSLLKISQTVAYCNILPFDFRNLFIMTTFSYQQTVYFLKGAPQY